MFLFITRIGILKHRKNMNSLSFKLEVEKKMKYKKTWITLLMLLLIILSIMTYYYMQRETDITYQGTFLCRILK